MRQRERRCTRGLDVVQEPRIGANGSIGSPPGSGREDLEVTAGATVGADVGRTSHCATREPTRSSAERGLRATRPVALSGRIAGTSASQRSRDTPHVADGAGRLETRGPIRRRHARTDLRPAPRTARSSRPSPFQARRDHSRAIASAAGDDAHAAGDRIGIGGDPSVAMLGRRAVGDEFPNEFGNVPCEVDHVVSKGDAPPKHGRVDSCKTSKAAEPAPRGCRDGKSAVPTVTPAPAILTGRRWAHAP